LFPRNNVRGRRPARCVHDHECADIAGVRERIGAGEFIEDTPPESAVGVRLTPAGVAGELHLRPGDRGACRRYIAMKQSASKER
jgi:hypothetical protein